MHTVYKHGGGGGQNCKIETQNKEKKVKNDNKKFRFTSYIQNYEKKIRKDTRYKFNIINKKVRNYENKSESQIQSELHDINM